MSTVTIELPPQEKQTQFNLRRWAELLVDPEGNKIEWRVETDRYGHVTLEQRKLGSAIFREKSDSLARDFRPINDSQLRAKFPREIALS